MNSVVKISVVVPVYNPGCYLQPNIESLLAQSMSSQEYEIIYVDDGSTDESPAVLDALADQAANVRVHHQENSGWPGKPRNVGVDLARGEYVQFVDQDDELTPEALERLYALAKANASDIVLSKVTGTMAGPSNVFRRTIDSCNLESFYLNESLTPHKMFRRDFLLQQGLRFAEGKRRLEDQLFMIQAYLAAENVSILGDYPCYVWHRRTDGKNTSSGYASPRDYFENLREVLDAIVSGTEPGELRNRLLRRHYRVEILGRVREPGLLRARPERRQDAFEVVRKLALERFSSGEVQDGLPPVARLRSTLLERGELDSLMTLAERCQAIKGRSTLNDLYWWDGKLVARVRLELTHADGSPVVVERWAGKWFLDQRLVEGIPGLEAGWEIRDPLEHVQAEVRVFDRDNQLWWFADDDLHGSLVRTGSAYQVIVTGTFRIDPMTLAGGRPMPRSLFDISTSFQVLGLGRGPRIGAERALVCNDIGPALLGADPLIVAPYWTSGAGNLSLDVGGRGSTFLQDIALERARIPRQRSRGEIPLRVATTADTSALVLGVSVPGVRRIMRAQIRSDGGSGATLSLPVPARRVALSLLDGEGRPAGRSIDVAPGPVRSVARKLKAGVGHSPRLRRAARKVLALLPGQISGRIRRVAARSRWLG